MFGLGLQKYLVVGAVIAFHVLLVGTYLYGYNSARNNAERATLEQTVKDLKIGKKVDEKINSLDDDGLCISLGGVPEAGKCN